MPNAIQLNLFNKDEIDGNIQFEQTAKTVTFMVK